ncbi:molybdopterin-dependent oxidoreductase [Methanocella sp. MCL-LM]|uniref:molybdopterin-dependent oxidoreductase n=1 Tax=Methanocella sp. MCL-LM TaxID=3412035 RepID=UPI003C7702EC
MKFKVGIALVFVAMIAFVVAISGCTGTTTVSPVPTAETTPTPAPAVSGPVVLSVTGKVSNPLNLTMADLQKYESKTITVAGKDNVTQEYTGVAYGKLLDAAGLTAEAKSANMIGADGYNKSLDVSAIKASADAIIAINADDTLKAVIPGESKGAWVGNLTTIVIE